MKAVINRYCQYPWVSGILVLINICVFGICLLTDGKLYESGRLSVFETLIMGEYDRFIWAMFIHVDLQHIFNNMIILFFLGAMIEKEMGHIAFGLTYFLSGISGNIVSLIFKIISNDWSASIGASGAVFGLDGALLAMIFFVGKKLPSATPVRVLLMVFLSLYNGFTGSNIDNAAHVGGLFMGFLLTVIIYAVRNKRNSKSVLAECGRKETK